MTPARKSEVVPAMDPSDRGATRGKSAEATALQRLEASRAGIRSAMEAHVRESAPSPESSRAASRSLGQRLLDRARRLPIIRTALAIRSLRRD